MTLAWVIGAGGLLGGAVRRELLTDDSVSCLPLLRFDWTAPATLASQLGSAAGMLAEQLQPGQRWLIVWAGGTGAMGSTEQSMAAETTALQALLSRVEAQPRLADQPGAFLLASSAGALYAGCRDAVISERSAVAPTTPYARAKLEQERLVTDFAARHTAVAALVARFSTLYGPGQTAAKPQGIISHIARRVVRNQPIQIYVPYDTIRDYLYVDDAARLVLLSLQHAQFRGGVTTKIIAAETPSTIAEIISTFKRLARRPPRIVTSASALSSLYLRRVAFESAVAPRAADIAGRPKTSLTLGIAHVLRAERKSFACGGGAR